MLYFDILYEKLLFLSKLNKRIKSKIVNEYNQACVSCCCLRSFAVNKKILKV